MYFLYFIGNLFRMVRILLILGDDARCLSGLTYACGLGFGFLTTCRPPLLFSFCFKNAHEKKDSSNYRGEQRYVGFGTGTGSSVGFGSPRELRFCSAPARVRVRFALSTRQQKQNHKNFGGGGGDGYPGGSLNAVAAAALSALFG